MPSIAFFLNPFIIRALLAVILISVLAATAGSFTIFRGLSFMVAGIAHAALAGAALAVVLEQYGYLRGLDPLFIALIFGVLMAIIIGASERAEHIERIEVSIGVAFALSMSLAILFISLMREYSVEAWALILGDILLLTTKDIIILSIITITVAFLFVLFMKEFIFISFDPEDTRAIGVNVDLYHTIMLVLIASSTVVLLKGVGAILVYAVLVVPPAIANKIAGDVYSVMKKSFIISIFSGILGILLAIPINVAPSALIGIILVIIYFIASIRKK